MKNLIARIKGYDYKGLFLRHGEKIGMGLIGAVVLAVLAITQWSGYDNSPDNMRKTAEKVDIDLRANPFPAARAAEFQVIPAEAQSGKLIGPILASNYELLTPFSPKLFSYRLPAEEPEILPPVELYARSGVFSMEKLPPEQQFDENGMPIGGPAAGGLAGIGAGAGMNPALAGAIGRGGNRNRNAAAAAFEAENALLAGGLDGGLNAGMQLAAVGELQMRRYNLVVGKVDRRRQLEKLKQKLHLDSNYEAAYYLEYIPEFKIQRQKAMPGPKPWSDDESSWQDLNIEASVDLLMEAYNFDPDVVPAEYTNVAVTSPLPHRTDAFWSFDMAGHPSLPKLEYGYQYLEQAANLAAGIMLEGVDASLYDQGPPPKGFARLQVDPMQMRAQAMQLGGEKQYQDLTRQFLGGANKGGRLPPQLAAMMENSGGAMAGSGVPGGRAAAAPATRMPPQRGGARGGMGMYGGGYDPSMDMDMMGMGMGGRMPSSMMLMEDPNAMNAMAMEADSLLFRYFDFDVEPGECYRYRVKLAIYNPSFEMEFVASPDVAVGETRESQNWSVPSTPAAVSRDVEYGLARVARKAKRFESELEVVQRDPEAATLVAHRIPVAPGEYVGGIVETPRYMPARMSFEREYVNFSSRDMLVDQVPLPALASSVQDDLKLTTQEVKDMRDRGVLDQAVAVTRFGEMVPLDADSKKALGPARDKYEAQKKEYDELKSSMQQAGMGMDPTMGGNDMYSQMLSEMGIDPSMMQQGGANPLRKNKKLMKMLKQQLGDQIGTGRPGAGGRTGGGRGR